MSCACNPSTLPTLGTLEPVWHEKPLASMDHEHVQTGQEIHSPKP